MSTDHSIQRDAGISFLRILATIFIIICHLGTYYQTPIIAEFFFVGVPIFFLISGYLYAQRPVSQWKTWYLKRWNTLMIPCYVWFILLLLFSFIFFSESPPFTYSILLFFNLQGVGFLCDHIKVVSYPGLGQLWFMTALMVCYFVLPLLQAYRDKIGALTISVKLWFSLAVFVIISFLMFVFGIHLVYIFTFSIGYFLGNPFYNLPHKMVYGPSLLFGGIGLRLLGRFYLDDTFLYNHIITTLTYTLIAVSFFILIPFVDKHILRFSPPRISRSLSYSDALTYYIYITHYFFFKGIINVETYLPEHQFWGTLVVLVFSVLSAILLKKLADPLISYLNKKHI